MSGGVRAARPGNRVNRVDSATSPCSLASGAPRQKWAPAEKLRWGLGSRLMSNRSGSGKAPGSWLAAARNRSRGWPLGHGTPWTSASLVGAESEQGGGGLMPGINEEDAVRSQVLAVLAVGVACGQAGHQVIGWRCGALIEQAGEVGQHLPGRVVGSLDRGAVSVALAREAAIERRDRPSEPVPVLGRNAEHLGDNGERQRPGEVRDQVHAACGGGP